MDSNVDFISKNMHHSKSLTFTICKNIFRISFSILLSEIIYRILSIIKEIIWYRKHYSIKNRYYNIITYGFQFNNKIKQLLYVLIIFYTIMLSANIDNNIWIFFNIEDLLYFIIIYVILRSFKYNESYIDIAQSIRAGNGIDYATGMASNYCHGYLYLQLPDKGDDIKSIHHRIGDYEDKHNVKFAIKRLFILVPDSLHSKPKLESSILEKAAPLETVVKNRAGVERPFKNDVYKFTIPINGTKNYYISVEGATPLLSFWESISMNITSTPEMKAMHREILLQFYKSVKQFTTDYPGTRNACEIVHYNDYDIDGNETDVGYVLKEHIEKMLVREKIIKV